MTAAELRAIPILNLAFIGDGVFDLLVREHLVASVGGRVGELNSLKVSLVNCAAQASAASAILPMLSDDELSVYRRGRNASPRSVSHHSTLSDYHAATGLEALFGYLYLSGQRERINELFQHIISLSNL